MTHHCHRRRITPATAFALGTSLVLLAGGPTGADDTDLVRVNTSKPYVMVILDTSSSMNLEIGTNEWHPLNGDYEESKIYRAKRALYEVMRDFENLHFGLMTFDVDELRIQSKHWVYGLAEPLTASWPLNFPRIDDDAALDPTDDAFTLGKHFDVDVPGVSAPGVGGSCEEPLDLADPIERFKAGRFAKLGSDGRSTTVLWVTRPTVPLVAEANPVYRLEVSAPGIQAATEALGDRTLTLRLSAQRVGDCAAGEDAGQGSPAVQTVEFQRRGEFLMADSGDRFVDTTSARAEGFAGFWEWQDAQGVSVCSDDQGFTGKGLESNYEDPGLLPPFTPEGFAPSQIALLTEDDPYCVPAGGGEVCQNLKFRTRVDAVYPEFRELDRGDFLPYHWKISSRDEFLRRLNPKHLSGEAPDYGVSTYFTDRVNPVTGTLSLKNAKQKPLVATGQSQLAKTVNDYRCWYLGPNIGPKGKCKIGNDELAFLTGWQQIAATRDPDYQCRKIYVIIISDGEDTCAGENLTADINDFDRNGIRTWIINVGDEQAAQSFVSVIATTQAELINLVDSGPGGLAARQEQEPAPFLPSSRAVLATRVPAVQNQATPGHIRPAVWSGAMPAAYAPTLFAPAPLAPASNEDVSPGDRLAQELRDILGQIDSDTRSFAGAAVPSVQTEADDKILLTSFRPLRDSAVWAGSALAFLKPLPVREDPPGSDRFVPDTSTRCSESRRSECFLWDAGEVLKTQVDLADPVGPSIRQRRVYYASMQSGDGVPLVRRPLEDGESTGGSTAEERDLWEGLGVPFRDGDPASEEAARAEARLILERTYAPKTARLDPDDPASEIEFLLGDTFHADPVVVGGPASNLLFSQNFENYRDFALKHRFRRKLLLTAANDAMVHFFDAGVAEIVEDEVRFSNGTGREVAAYVPRAVMPKLRPLALGKSHTWSVDGSLSIADVYLDPVHAGSPDAADREWRTVLIAGLRRGGEAVYALDITQPDELEERTLPGPPAQVVVVPRNPQSVPDCHDRRGSGADELACDSELEFPSPLWEFRDIVEISGERYRLDEDDNGEFDLAFTWSRPNIGRIQVQEGDEVVDKFVAVFGGGLDPELPNDRGDWLYIVDIETGKAIYKQQLLNPYNTALSGGAAASEPAAVDTDQDGLLDRIYVGTVGGFVYRVDLGPDGDGDLPVLRDHPLLVEVQPGQLRIAAGVKRVSDRRPRVVFDNVNPETNRRLPFFVRPSVVFTPLLAPNYALALGDGDREDLWSQAPSPGRFYLFVDDTDERPEIITSAKLEKAPVEQAVGDFLFSPRFGNRNGWVLPLAAEERVVSEAFALSGITVFSTYTPNPPLVTREPGAGPDAPGTCTRTGSSRIFAVLTTNANGVLFDSAGNRSRSTAVDTLVGRAFADLSATQNQAVDGGAPPRSELPPSRALILEELKKLFPSSCRFANYRIDVRAVASDTRLVEVAPVPVCVIQKNWREF